MIMKLLIVDDNPSIRFIIKKMCSDLFTEIIECEDGDEAIQITNEEKPDWIIMDFKMKRMDGITAAGKIISSYTDIKIIIVSQFNDESLKEASYKSGAIDFVEKENLPRVLDIINNNHNKLQEEQ